MTTGTGTGEDIGAEGRVYNVGGQDWDEIVRAARESGDGSDHEHLVVNMGPQHPSTHGVLRLILTLDGETVIELRPVIGYLAAIRQTAQAPAVRMGAGAAELPAPR